jgi:hypothetical protein
MYNGSRTDNNKHAIVNKHFENNFIFYFLKIIKLTVFIKESYNCIPYQKGYNSNNMQFCTHGLYSLILTHLSA